MPYLAILRKHVVNVTKVAANLAQYITMSVTAPVAITQNGEVKAFLISAETYDEILEALAELELLKKG